MSNIFTKIKTPKIGSSKFNMSYDYKLTCNMGDLIPIHCQEVLPGDFFRHRTQMLLRMQALLAPIMHRVDVTIHHFYVPTRLLWDNWEDFITGNGLEKESFVEHALPVISVNDAMFASGSLYDYLGLPSNGQTAADTGLTSVSAFPLSVYAKIYNDYYRDQNVGDEMGIVNGLVDGFNGNNSIMTSAWTVTGHKPLKRAWEHDYFTSALPWAQKGPSVDLPLGTFDDVPVVPNTDFPTAAPSFEPESTAPNNDNVEIDPGGNLDTSKGTLNWKNPNLTAKTSDLTASSASIRDLRRAFKLQEWLEKNARSGTRYTESLMSHFGVKSSDSRLDRAEYLGGSKSPAQISEVLQTSETTETGTPLANMAGHGVSVNSGKGYSYKVEEHGYIMSIMSIMPRTSYMQGIDRMWSRKDRYDYYWPSFQHIGEQEILNKELYVADDGLNDDTFGYIPRYSEYKYNNSRVSGEFRSTLDYWHLSRKFANRPALNKNFIDANPSDRIFATQGYDDQLLVQLHHSIKATRKMAKFANPHI